MFLFRMTANGWIGAFGTIVVNQSNTGPTLIVILQAIGKERILKIFSSGWVQFECFRMAQSAAFFPAAGKGLGAETIFTARQHSSSYAKRCISYDRFCLTV